MHKLCTCTSFWIHTPFNYFRFITLLFSSFSSISTNLIYRIKTKLQATYPWLQQTYFLISCRSAQRHTPDNSHHIIFNRVWIIRFPNTLHYLVLLHTVRYVHMQLQVLAQPFISILTIPLQFWKTFVCMCMYQGACTCMCICVCHVQSMQWDNSLTGP